MSYGCYDRKPFVDGQWLHGIDSKEGFKITIFVENRMAKECQYQKNDKYSDAGCVGCKHRQVKTNEQN